MIQINIEIQKRNRFKDFFHKIFNHLEDMIFFIIQKIPERFIPHWLMDCLEHYTNKRINQLKQQIISDRWQSAELEKAVQQINHER